VAAPGLLTGVRPRDRTGPGRRGGRPPGRRSLILAEDTVDCYGSLRDGALDAGPSELEGPPASDQLAVLALRIRIPASALRTVSGRQLFALGTGKGMIDAEGTRKISVSDATVAGTYGRATYVLDGEKTPLKVRFRYQGDRWKVKITDSVKAVDTALVATATENGVSVAGLVEQLVIETYGRERAEAVLTPVGRGWPRSPTVRSHTARSLTGRRGAARPR